MSCVLVGMEVGSVESRKSALKVAIERQRSAILHFDNHHNTNTDPKLVEDEYKQYTEYTDELAKMKKQLEALRLEPDSFMMMKENQRVILEITANGEMIFLRVVPIEEPIIPPNMASYSRCRIEVTENGYEIRYAEKIKFIDEMRLITSRPITELTPNRTTSLRSLKWTNSFSVRLNSFLDHANNNNASANNDTKDNNASDIPTGDGNNTETSTITTNGVKIDWKDGTYDIFITYDSVSQELTEVIGCHMNRYKRAKVKHVNRLKEIYKLKSTLYDSSNQSHEDLLTKLWSLANPHKPMIARKSQEWKSLGFQGTDPATDFRGMGLLGLHNLIYFISRYPEKVDQIREKKREYPFAVTGINITFMLLDLLNIQKAGGSQEGPTSPLWDTPLLVFFCMAEENSGSVEDGNLELDNNAYPFEEVYCMCFDILDGLWAMLDAKYMDFPKVMARVKQLITRVAEGRPTNWVDFRNRVNQLVISSSLDTPPTPPLSRPQLTVLTV